MCVCLCVFAFACMCVCVCVCLFGVFYTLPIIPIKISQRDILNSIDREMSGDLREGFKTVGKWHTITTNRFHHNSVVQSDVCAADLSTLLRDCTAA